MAHDSKARILAHLVGMERQMLINEAYVKSGGEDVIMAQIGNGHLRDAIREIRRELAGEKTYPDWTLFRDEQERIEASNV